MFLPPTPSVGDQVAIGLVSIHLIGHCCISFVSILGISAGCTGVVGTDVKAMGPTVVHVVEEPGAPVASRGSAATLAGGLVGWLLDGC